MHTIFIMDLFQNVVEFSTIATLLYPFMIVRSILEYNSELLVNTALLVLLAASFGM